jgi:hypothetical protein
MAEFESVLLARTVVEAQIAEAVLQEARIPCVVENFTSDPYDGMWVLQRGYGRVLAPHEEAERARAIIAEALAAAPLPEDATAQPDEETSGETDEPEEPEPE